MLSGIAQTIGSGAILLSGLNGKDRVVLQDHAEFVRLNFARIAILDNVDMGLLPDVVGIVRAAESAGTVQKFIISTQNAIIAARLFELLMGQIREVDLVPIQPDEAYASYLAATRTEATATSTDVLQPALVQRPAWDIRAHWLRGGLPESLGASSNQTSHDWRRDYWQALRNSYHGEWGLQPVDKFQEVLDRIVRLNGQQWDEANCRTELDVDRASVRRVTSMLSRMGLLRILHCPKSKGHPTLLVRDSGLLHAAIGASELSQLSDKEIGHSWEAFATEALSSTCSRHCVPEFFRDKEGNEIDLILDFRPSRQLCFAIEFKVDEGTNAKAGFWQACKVVDPTHHLVVHAGSIERMAGTVQCVPLLKAMQIVRLALK